jgi:hypothetical protein
MLPSPEVLLSLSAPVLRSLLDHFAPRGLPSLPAKPTPHAIARAIHTHGAPGKLGAVLSSTIARFASPRGRLAIVEGARAMGDSRADAFLASPAHDVAATLAITRATGKPPARRAAKRLFALATHRVERDLAEHPTYELVADAAPVSRDPAAVLPILERALGKQLLEAWPALEPDGTLRLSLFLRQPTENRLVWDDEASRIVQRRDVPVAVDVVRIAPDGARVSFTLAMPELLRTYASALSLSLRPSFTLRPLHDLTRARLATLTVPGVTRIDVVALRFRRPGGSRVEVRGPDALDPQIHSPRSGYVDRATIRLTLDDGARVDAFLQLPHRVEISSADPAHVAAVRAALSALGLFAPGALPDDARSLAPYEHGEWRLRAVLPGTGFEALVRRKLLVRALASHVSSHEHRMHGAGYVVRDVAGEPGVQYALAEDRSLGARLVSAKDRVVWRLDRSALAAALARDLGATRADAPLDLEGLLDLGVVTLPSGKLRFVYAMGEPAQGWIDAVRRACSLGVTPVVLVPKGHAGHARGMLEIELDVAEQLGCKRIGRVLGRAAEALGVPHEVDRWRLCDEDVVVDAAKQITWVTGVRVPLKERPFGLVLHLAKVGGLLLATKDLGARISNAGAPDVTARKAKAEAEEQIRKVLDEAGVDSAIVNRLIVAEGKKGYRLGVSARVL